MTGSTLKNAAKQYGYESTNYTSKNGQKVFYNKKTKTCISQDIGSGNGMGPYNGGVWKIAKSPEELNSKDARMGTYDANLNRIGD
ncbi:toxin C-terminal domain-containing protein [Paenibacillus yanchengensis]|uniref:Toxin C-terminal domain-containing protein n=1 Tax=Paenibacillus yanchengensis TaxID=2035833 RepID=A0ABW4YPG5_9BACL